MDFPTYLYRYRPAKVGYFRDELEALNRQEIFLTSASFLNDPFDCSPVVERSTLSDITMLIRSVGLTNYRRAKLRRAADTGLYSPAELRKAKRLYSDIVKAAKFEAAIGNGILDSYRERDLLISCFSEVPDSILMWTHYAQNSSGYVVKYRLDIRSDLIRQIPVPLSVNYVNKRPVVSTIDLIKFSKSFPVKLDQARDNQVMEALYYTKADAWAYEKEWRLAESRRLGASYKYFPTLIPVSIIYGSRTAEEDKKLIYSILPKIQKFAALQDRVSYNLRIVSVP